MPLTDKQKNSVLINLRFWFNHTDEIEVEPNRSQEFSQQVRSDVDEIVEHEHHFGVNGWGERCRNLREKNHYQDDHVAELLGVSRKSIHNQEKKNEHTNIDPFYLEAFSLIYRTSPYELIGLPNPHRICPFTSLEDKSLKLCNVIINSLYDEQNPDKLAALTTIVKIGKLHYPQYSVLKSFFAELVAFRNVFAQDPLKSPLAEDDKWRGTIPPSITDIASFDSDTYNTKRLYWETYLLLEDLYIHNPARLNDLAQLSLCDDQTLAKLTYFMQELGYPKDPKSLNSYSVDNLMDHSRKKRKGSKKARGLI